MSQEYALLLLVVMIASVIGIGAVCVTLWGISQSWRPIIQAYLEAKAAAAGAPMYVPDPKATPGKLYTPTPPKPQWDEDA